MAISKKRRDKRRRRQSGWGDMRWLKDELVVEERKEYVPQHVKNVKEIFRLEVGPLAYMMIHDNLKFLDTTPQFSFSLKMHFGDDREIFVDEYLAYDAARQLSLEENPHNIVESFIAEILFCDDESSRGVSAVGRVWLMARSGKTFDETYHFDFQRVDGHE